MSHFHDISGCSNMYSMISLYLNMYSKGDFKNHINQYRKLKQSKIRLIYILKICRELMDISITIIDIIQIVRDDELTDSNLSSHIMITKMNVIIICQNN